MHKESNRLSRLAMVLGRGTIDLEFAEKLEEVVRNVQELQKKGSITLTVVVEPAVGRDKQPITDQVWLSTEIKVNAPKPALPSTLQFVDQKGELSSTDPQLELDVVRAHRESMRAPDEAQGRQGRSGHQLTNQEKPHDS